MTELGQFARAVWLKNFLERQESEEGAFLVMELLRLVRLELCSSY